MSPTITLIVIIAIFGFALLLVWVKLLKICRANEVFIISGGRHTDPIGKDCGYRVIKGGKALILPLWEKLDRLDLTNMIIDVRVLGAYSKGGIPLNIQGVANVKIPGQGPTLANAVVRLLSKDRVEIMQIAKETLEGNLRGVMAQLTPEQVNEDKIKFAQSLMDEADDDMHKLGLILDTVKIQNVWDDVGYLDSIGRIRNAEIQRTARIAEAEAESESKVRQAENKRETEIARIEAMTNTIRAQTSQEITEMRTGKDVLVAKEKGDVAALVAQARAEVDVQTARVEQVRRRLKADVIEPARAQMNEAINHAQGEAAEILETGRANADALRAIAEMWTSGGPAARDAMIFTKLENLMRIITGTIRDLQIERLTVLPAGAAGGNGIGRGNGTGNLSSSLVRLNEELKAALGVDVSKMLPPADGRAGKSTSRKKKKGSASKEAEEAAGEE